MRHPHSAREISSTPLLFYGSLFLLGNASALAFHLVYVVPFVLCFWLYRAWTTWKLLGGLLVYLIGVVGAVMTYTLPLLSEEGIEGEGIFKISALSYSHSPFQKSFLYKGNLRQFPPFSKNIPCSIYFNENKLRPPASSSLRVKGRLIPKGEHRYVFKVSAYEPIPHTYSLAEWRFKVKNRLRSHLRAHFPDFKSRAFVLSMLTGEIDDRLLALEFNRLGILHLLGISGFQFTLLAFLVGTLLRFAMPHKAADIVLMVLLSAYTFILGDSPPIERAWVGSMLYLTARIFGYRISALNALGVALLWQLAKDPLLIFHLGFQFSFLCTAAILLTYPLFRSVLYRWFAKRSFREVVKLPFVDQHGQLLSFFFRETLALNGAIHLVTLPLIFFHFHKFPLLSLVYNLFLPAIVSLLYLLLVMGLSLPILGPWLLAITGKLTQGILKVATHPPALYDFQWRVHDFPLTAAITTISLILVASYWASSRASSMGPFGEFSR